MTTPEELRNRAMSVFLAAEAGPADDLSKHLNEAADTIKQQADLLWQALEVLQEGCSIIAWPGTDFMKIKIKAQALIPKIKAAQEKT